MLTQQTERWYQLYSNNQSIYPASATDFYADGQVWADDISEAFNEIALGVTSPDELNESDVHIWQISERLFGFKLNEDIQIIREEI